MYLEQLFDTATPIDPQGVAAQDRASAVGVLVRPGLVRQRAGEVPHGQQ